MVQSPVCRSSPRRFAPVTYGVMSKVEPNARKNQRHIKVVPELKKALAERKLQTGLPETRQILDAIEAYLQKEPSNAHRAFLRPTEERVVKLLPAPDALWNRLHERKKNFGFDLDDQIHIALTLYFADLEGLNPFAETSYSSPQIATVAAKSREELRAQLGALGLRVASEFVASEESEKALDPLLAAARIVLSNAALSQNDGAGAVTLLLLPSVPCGPWREALNDATPLALPRQLADIVGAREGDLLVPTDGQSMVEAGVPDGGRVVMRPLRGRRPQLGEIVLCCIERENGVWESTIKHWFETPRGAPILKDGKLREHPLPPDPVEVHPVAVLVGVMGRATQGTAKGLPVEAREKRRFRRDHDEPLSE